MQGDGSEFSVEDFSDELDRRGLKHVIVYEDLDGGIHTVVGGTVLHALAMMRECAIPILRRDLRKKFLESPETDE